MFAAAAVLVAVSVASANAGGLHGGAIGLAAAPISLGQQTISSVGYQAPAIAKVGVVAAPAASLVASHGIALGQQTISSIGYQAPALAKVAVPAAIVGNQIALGQQTISSVGYQAPTLAKVAALPVLAHGW